MNFSNTQINIKDLPKSEELDLTIVNPKFYLIILLNIGLIFIVIIAAFLINYSYLDFEIIRNINLNIIIGILIVLWFITIISYKIGFKFRKYTLREKDIIYTKGLFYNQLSILPFTRIQHTEMSTSFLEKQLGLSTLNVYSAGESGSDLKIRGLLKEDALKINILLIKIINERL